MIAQHGHGASHEGESCIELPLQHRRFDTMTRRLNYFCVGRQLFAPSLMDC